MTIQIQEKDKRFLLFVERLVKKGLMGVVLFLLDEIQKLEERINGTLKGEDGHTPTNTELLGLIEPLIPEPIRGKDGRDGIDGKNGADGINGENGIDGINGVGKDGRDGSPDNPQQIADKLNTLNEAVDLSVIKGLKEELESANMVFTAYKFPKYVVGDGITYFESQGYTYSGKTLTMTIPPSNYLRSFY